MIEHILAHNCFVDKCLTPTFISLWCLKSLRPPHSHVTFLILFYRIVHFQLKPLIPSVVELHNYIWIKSFKLKQIYVVQNEEPYNKLDIKQRASLDQGGDSVLTVLY